jgi:hypothetical protein
MNYALIRTAKLKTMGNIAASGQHNFRERETPNADPSRTALNTTTGAESSEKLVEAVKDRLATVKTVRKNAVLVLEYFVGASPEWFAEQTPKARKAYFDDAEKWLKERHGAENVVCITRQYDESTPHIAAYVVPIDPKGRLNASHWQDGRQKMHALQTDFAKDVGKQHGLERGIEGSKADHVPIKQYYELVNQPFEELPVVVTRMPAKLRPEPEKPGLLAGSSSKDAYQRDHAKWEKDRAATDAQTKAHIAERRAERNAAVAIVKRHQAQAREAKALKVENRKLKKSNGDLLKKIAKLLHLQAIVDLFKPIEIIAAQERKRIQEAEREAEKVRLANEAAHQVELARSKAAIDVEVERRIKDIPTVMRDTAGAEHTFAVEAAAALNKVGYDASAVDWNEVEKKTMHKAIAKYRQSPESVVSALLKHSPLRADPSSHGQLREFVKTNLPDIEAQRQKLALGKDTGPKLSGGR